MNLEDESPDLMPIEQVGVRVGRSVSWIRLSYRTGTFPSPVTRGRWSRRDVENWIRANHQATIGIQSAERSRPPMEIRGTERRRWR